MNRQETGGTILLVQLVNR